MKRLVLCVFVLLFAVGCSSQSLSTAELKQRADIAQRFIVATGFSGDVDMSLNPNAEAGITNSVFFKSPGSWLRFRGTVDPAKARLLQQLMYPGVPLEVLPNGNENPGD